jgi:hypothetical protein
LFVSFLLNDKPWFLNWGKTSCYTHHTFLLGFPMGWSFTMHQAPLLHRQKSGHLSTHYIFIASCIMRFSWSVSFFLLV